MKMESMGEIFTCKFLDVKEYFSFENFIMKTYFSMLHKVFNAAQSLFHT
jgi:hypothetical protein